jgi:hypothetical protein
VSLCSFAHKPHAFLQDSAAQCEYLTRLGDCAESADGTRRQNSCGRPCHQAWPARFSSHQTGARVHCRSRGGTRAGADAYGVRAPHLFGQARPWRLVGVGSLRIRALGVLTPGGRPQSLFGCTRRGLRRRMPYKCLALAQAGGDILDTQQMLCCHRELQFHAGPTRPSCVTRHLAEPTPRGAGLSVGCTTFRDGGHELFRCWSTWTWSAARRAPPSIARRKKGDRDKLSTMVERVRISLQPRPQYGDGVERL